MACGQQSNKTAELYEASELSSLMRDMVEFSKASKATLNAGGTIDSVPQHLFNLKHAKATRDEHLEESFQSLTDPYLNALRGIERGDSQHYYYKKSINACKSCHQVYCGGPMSIINQLPL